jgi:Cd2+/Zn2+-exporting ATPase
VGQVTGVQSSRADHATGQLTLSLAGPDLNTEHIAEALSSAGYSLVNEWGHHDGMHAHPVVAFARFVFSKRDTALTAVAGALTLIGLALIVARAPGWSRMAPFAAAIAVGGAPLARRAWQEAALSRSLGINTLMVIAVVGAVIIGEWAEGAIVVVLFSLGEALEGFAAEQSRQALDKLLDLAPLRALLLLDSGETREVAVEQLRIGDVVLVRPGDRVSVDGTVVSGTSSVDQAAITGESVPVSKQPGDRVYAGTVNTFGALQAEVSRLAGDSTLSLMVRLVQEAQARQPRVQRFMDRFARIYTPSVAVVAALVATVPPLLLDQPLVGDGSWLGRAIQILVIACPCALVISTPVSLVSSMTNAASRGVLVKGGRALEALARVRAFAFDKTGTLTEGQPKTTDVVDICTCGECTENCGLQHAAALEAQTSHPLAQAILAEATARGVIVPSARDVTVLGGRGMEGTVNGELVTVASHAHFDEYVPHERWVCQRAEDLASQGKTVIMVQHDEKLCAVIGIADRPRPDSRPAIRDLKARGIHTVMLTGDNESVADDIGRQVGIDEVHAGLLPQEKVSALTRLREDYKLVAMVGDGVNDAPALAQADVGIAMGGAGSDQAMETADIVLLGDDLAQLDFIVGLSRRTRRTITANILFALGVKAAVFGLAAAGLATLWMAVVADVGASMIVILNGMRLRRARHP